VLSETIIENQPEQEPLLAVENATLGYGRNIILRNVDLSVRPGEFWCFLGPNGEGKTTLIKALLGAIKPKAGRIGAREDVFKRQRVSYVPQRLELNDALPTTVTEFVLSGLVGVPSTSGTRGKRLERVLDLVGLSKLKDRSFWAMSGGQQQRALLARALVRDPGLLVVDEPTAGLDLNAAQAVLDVLTRLHHEYQLTVVFVTHDLQTAADRGSHAALFKNGRVVAGAMAEVLTPDHLGAVYGVSIGVDVVDGRRVISVDRPDQTMEKLPDTHSGVVEDDRDVAADGDTADRASGGQASGGVGGGDA